MAQKSARTTRLQNQAVGDGTPTAAGPTVQDARSFSRRMDNLQEKQLGDYVPYNQGGNAGAGDAFPMRMVPHDKYDDVVQLKGLADEKKYGQKMLTTDDLQWLQRKKEAQNALQYKQYASSVLNLKNPAELKILNKIHPEFYEEKEEIIDQRKDMLKTLAKIRARGWPESREELELMFAIASGAVAPPEGPLWDPSQWTDAFGVAARDNAKTLARGLFNPSKLLGGVDKPTAFDSVPQTFGQTDPVGTNLKGFFDNWLGGSAPVLGFASAGAGPRVQSLI